MCVGRRSGWGGGEVPACVWGWEGVGWGERGAGWMGCAERWYCCVCGAYRCAYIHCNHPHRLAGIIITT